MNTDAREGLEAAAETQEHLPEPEPSPAPASGGSPADQGQDWAKKEAEYQAQIAERDRKIQDIEATRKVLEARIQDTGSPKGPDPDVAKQAQGIMEKQAYDPSGAAKDLADLLASVSTAAEQRAIEAAMSRLGPQLDARDHLKKVYDANEDLIKAGVEPIIESRARALMSQGKTLVEAVDGAIKEYRDSVTKLTPKAEPAPAPRGAIQDGRGALPKPSEGPSAEPVLTGSLDEARAELSDRTRRLGQQARPLTTVK